MSNEEVDKIHEVNWQRNREYYGEPKSIDAIYCIIDRIEHKTYTRRSKGFYEFTIEELMEGEKSGKFFVYL